MPSTKKKRRSGWGVVLLMLLLAGAGVVVMLLGQGRLFPTLSHPPLPVQGTSQPTPPPPTPTPPPTPVPTPAPVPYRFGEPLAERGAVEDDWFADAVFLGDSRTEGLQLYSGLKTATFFCYRGLSVFTARTRACVTVNGETITLMDAIQTGQWGKVYIMFGLNELGYSADSFEQGLLELVDMVAQAQPEAVIYLQTLPPVNEPIARSKGSGAHVNNRQVDAFNEVVRRVAALRKTALVDVAASLRSETGILSEEHSADGVHFRRVGYEIWLDYLRRHTIEMDYYLYSRQAPPLPTEPVQPPTTEPLPTEPVQPLPTEPLPAEPVQPPTTEPLPAEPVQPLPTEPLPTEPMQPPTTEPLPAEPVQPPTTEPLPTEPVQPPTTEPLPVEPMQPPTTEPLPDEPMHPLEWSDAYESEPEPGAPRTP